MMVSKTSTYEYMETNRGPSQRLIPWHILNSNKHSTSLRPMLLNKAITRAVCRLPSMRLLAFNNESNPEHPPSNTDKTLARFPTTITCANATQKGTPRHPRTPQSPNILEHTPHANSIFGAIAKLATKTTKRLNRIMNSQKLVWRSLIQADPLLINSLLPSRFIPL